jgi:hypothetical protein
LRLAVCDEKNRLNEQRHTHGIAATTQATTQRNHLKSVGIADDAANVNNSNGIGERHSNNGEQRHTSVLPFTTTTTKYKSNAHDADLLLAADWLPAVETMTRLVRDELVDVDFVSEYTSEFVMYWLASGVAKGSWDAVFFRQCLDQWKLRRFSWSRR